MMAYMEGCIAVIRDSKGNNLRDVKGNNDGERDVFLKFDEEYSIYLKNKTSHKIGVRISIDGTDVLGGSYFMVPAYGSSEIERFVVDGDLDKGKRFKFVSLASEHEGIVNPDSKDNGLITIDFYKEEEVKKDDWWDDIKPWYVPYPYPVYPYPYPVYPYPQYPYYPYKPYTYIRSDSKGTHYYGGGGTSGRLGFRGSMGSNDGGIKEFSSGDASTPAADGISYNLCDAGSSAPTFNFCDAKIDPVVNRCLNKEVKVSDGATVEGQASTQKFATVKAELEKTPYTTIKIRLRGHKYSTVTTKDKKFCPGCRCKVGWDFKFCPECGFKTNNELFVKQFCHECRSEVGCDHRYCWKCGTEVVHKKL